MNKIIYSMHEFKSIMDNSGEHIVVDFESKGTRWWQNDFAVIGVAIGGELNCEYDAIYLPFMQYNLETKLLTPCNAHSNKLFDAFITAIEGKKLIYHNSIFDHSIVEHFGTSTYDCHADTMLWWHQLDNSHKRRYGLKIAMVELLGWEEANDKELNKQIKSRGGKKGKDIYLADVDIIGKYACLDAVATWNLYKLFLPQMQENNLMNYWETLIRPYMLLLKEQYVRGVPINRKHLEENSKKMDSRLEILAKEFIDTNHRYIKMIEKAKFRKKLFSYKNEKHRRAYARAHHLHPKFNIQSKQQLGMLLFTLMGLESLALTDKGADQVDELVLKQLKNKHHSIPVLLDYNKTLKMKQYCDRFLKYSEYDGLMHPNFSQTGSVSGRLTERTDSPMLTINKKDLDLLNNIVSRPGMSLLYSDFNSVEPMWLSHFSGDETYLRIANGEGEIYLELVDPIFGKEKAALYDPSSAETIAESKERLKDERDVCKPVHLACGYGATKYSIARIVYGSQDAYSLAMANIILKKYWKKFKKVKIFESKLRYIYADQGFIFNGLGRMLNMTKTKDILNRFIQASGHDTLINRNLIIDRMRKERDVDMHPYHIDEHDACIWECNDKQLGAGKKIMDDSLIELNQWLSLDVELKASLKVGKSLADIHREEK